MRIKIAFDGETLNVIGVNPDGTCEIPWSIGGSKKAFRKFAVTLAEGIPDAAVHETPKGWTVKVNRLRVDIAELLEAASALRRALETLRPGLLVAA